MGKGFIGQSREDKMFDNFTKGIKTPGEERQINLKRELDNRKRGVTGSNMDRKKSNVIDEPTSRPTSWREDAQKKRDSEIRYAGNYIPRDLK